MINIGVIIDNVRRLVQDPDPSPRTSDADCFAWLNDGLELFQSINEFLGVIDDLHIAENLAPRQEYSAFLPVSAKVPRKHIRCLSSRVSSGFGINGRITRVDLSLLQREDPKWFAHESEREDTVIHECIDPNNKLAFWLYPTPKAGVAVDVQVQVQLPKIDNKTEPLDIDSEYAGPLTDFLAYRIFLQDADDTNNHSAALEYYQRAVDAVKLIQAKDAARAV